MYKFRRHMYGILSFICLVIAILCMAYEPIKSHLVNSYQPTVTRDEVLQNERRAKAHATYNMRKVKAANMENIIKARAHSNDVAVIGQMLVPSIGLHLPINMGVSNPSLLLGAGTMRRNMVMGKGNYALAGHHMINKQALFTPLWSHAKLGTQVYITNMKQVYIYRITVRKIISPYDVKVINNTKAPIITLITCNDTGSKRLLLQGKLIRTTALSALPAPIQQDMSRNTNNHDVLKGY